MCEPFIRHIAVALALVSSAPRLCAQFQELTTDHTGSAAWFSSDLRLRNSSQATHAKIFRADSDGRITLIVERSLEQQYALLQNPEVSGDGTVLSYDAHRYCHPGITCRPLAAESAFGVIAQRGSQMELAGYLSMSRNGRFLFREGYNFSGPTRQVEIVDRSTGARRQFPVSNPVTLFGKWRVSSSGSALVYADGLWLLRFSGDYVRVPASNLAPTAIGPAFSRALIATMDDAGSFVVYQTTTDKPSLIGIRLGDSQEQTLVNAPDGATNPVLSADGRRLLYLSPANASAQVWVMDLAGGVSRQVTRDEGGIVEATLSGDGRVAWAVTYAGRLLRIDADTGTIREIVVRTVALDVPALVPALSLPRGGLVRLNGRGLAPSFAASTLPLVTELAGVSVRVDGQPLPLVSVSPFEIVFQVPWELRSTTRIEVQAGQSLFEDRLSRPVQVVDSAPEFLRIAESVPIIIHEDFRGLVTANDRAKPGEILHLYATGLGPVSPSVPTGEPAPATQLSRITEQLHAYWAGGLPTNMPLPEVLFAGLAPGLVGVYQVDVRVPQIAPSPLGISLYVNASGTLAQFEVGR